MFLNSSLPKAFFCVGIFIICSLNEIKSQEGDFTSKEIKKIEKADRYFTSTDYQDALDIYQVLADKYSNNISLQRKKADCYMALNMPQEASEIYLHLITLKPSPDPDLVLVYAKTLLSLENYEEAREQFKLYNELIEQNTLIANNYVNDFVEIEKYYNDSALYGIELLKVNDENANYGALRYKDQFYCISSSEAEDPLRIKHFSDIYAVDQVSNKMEKLSGGINSKVGDLSITIASETGEAYITRFNESKESEKTFVYKLYKVMLEEDGTSFSKPQKVEIEGFNFNIAYSSISSDGNYLYFASDAPGGYGGWDIYSAEKSSNGFNNVQNLGLEINTVSDENHPYLFNNTTLFYCSNGLGGLGGKDIFVISLDDKSDKPRNLGYPINSKADDFNIFIASKNGGYFSSNRQGGAGSFDIYSFDVKQYRLVGEVVNKENGMNIKNVPMLIASGKGNDSLMLADNGKFSLVTHPDRDLEIKIDKPGFEKNSFTFNLLEASFSGTPIYDLGLLEIKKIIGTERDTPPAELVVPAVIAAKPEEEKPIIIKAQYKNLSKIVFRVQVAASKTPLSETRLEKIYSGDRKLFMFREEGWFKYAIGESSSYHEADDIRKQCNVNGAFVAAYKGEQKLILRQAIEDSYLDYTTPDYSDVLKYYSETLDSTTIFYAVNSFRPAKEEITKLNSMLNSYNSDDNLLLAIEAYTDIQGSAAYNRSLSLERVNNLKTFFEEGGIPEDIIIVAAQGEENLNVPCSNDCSPEIHQKNRRAVIKLLKKPE